MLPSNSSPVQPVSITRESGLKAYTSAKYSEGVSLTRQASDMAQVALPLVQAVAGAIPLRRFQISRERANSKQNTQSSSIDSNGTTDTEMRLIRNFHVQQTVVRDLLYELII
ncbi:hypothetical protein P692DRAFT_20883997 [Suillus brevipes Sb2]|nr:hypothetical protein P692DRAFT_20883997 [Suillus brevipes Sb2]